MLKKKIGRNVEATFFIFLFFYFFSREEQGRACTFMEIQVFC